ncbi:DUF5316 domain-containing protein [Paenibacillus sp. OV219]|uniref:DUF5316 domain-containing protein n=1 Tax=Paenibacillus sp. OV219 TaxID=1884377 RepID=UPI0008BC6743|nr:DUF5316 domain-containing protein [Paenibacillus sp. OV219]SEO97664.1 hypothetical protein SAMN05518847_113164 [Paenibacillus sp. OV219]
MKLAKYSFLYGLIVSFVLLALTIFMNSSTIQRVSGVIGLVLFICTIITSGAMVSGDRGRANYSNEDPNDKKQRENVAMACFVAAIPILLLWGFLKYD